MKTKEQIEQRIKDIPELIKHTKSEFAKETYKFEKTVLEWVLE